MNLEQQSQNITLINIYNLSKINVKINNPDLIKLVEDSKNLQNDIERINWSMHSGNYSPENINLLSNKKTKLNNNIDEINIKLNELNYTEIPANWLLPIKEIVTPKNSMISMVPSFSGSSAKNITRSLANISRRSVANISSGVKNFSGKVSNFGSRAKNITRNIAKIGSNSVKNISSGVKNFSGKVSNFGTKTIKSMQPIKKDIKNPVQSTTIQQGGKYSKKKYKSIRKSKRKN